MASLATKFGRNYILTVQKTDVGSGLPLVIPNAPSNYADYLQVSYPVTIDFDIQRHSLSFVNQANFRVYNLSKQSRDSILRAPYLSNQTPKIQFNAGYGDGPDFPMAFAGTVFSCTSARGSGETEYITTIDASDGGSVANNLISTLEYPAGTPYLTIIRELVDLIGKSNLGVTVNQNSVGTFGSFNSLGVTGRAWGAVGNPLDRLREIVGDGCVFIDNGILYVVPTNQYVAVDAIIPTINATNIGLLGTPILQGQMMTAELLFEPSLYVGQQIYLQTDSETPKSYSGYYRINGIRHQGTISGAVCGDATTTIEVYAPGAPTPT
jgi:hypothetical protein